MVQALLVVGQVALISLMLIPAKHQASLITPLQQCAPVWGTVRCPVLFST